MSMKRIWNILWCIPQTKEHKDSGETLLAFLVAFWLQIWKDFSFTLLFVNILLATVRDKNYRQNCYLDYYQCWETLSKTCVKLCSGLARLYSGRRGILNTLFKISIIFFHWLSEIQKIQKNKWGSMHDVSNNSNLL